MAEALKSMSQGILDFSTTSKAAVSGLTEKIESLPGTANAKTRRTKKWQRIMKNWQLFILPVTESEGRIVKKHLDEYKLALKTFRSAMAKFDEKEKSLQIAQELKTVESKFEKLRSAGGPY